MRFQKITRDLSTKGLATKSRLALVERISVARVRPRTSKGITAFEKPLAVKQGTDYILSEP